MVFTWSFSAVPFIYLRIFTLNWGFLHYFKEWLIFTQYPSKLFPVVLSSDTNYKQINSKPWSYQIHHTGPNATRVLVSYREVPSPYQAQSTTTSQQSNQGHTYQLVSSIRPQGLITLGQGRANKTWGQIGIRVPGYAPQWSRTKIDVWVRENG